MWPHVYVICACLVFLSVGDLLVNRFVMCVCVMLHLVGYILEKIVFFLYHPVHGGGKLLRNIQQTGLHIPE
jgi:DMSO reductase anchor subunit